MRRPITIIAILACVVLAGYAAWSAIFQVIYVRYKLTVEVDVEDQIKTGSGVIEITYAIYPDSFVNLGGPDAHPKVTGYAVTVDLGDKGLLLLTFANANRTPNERSARINCPLDDMACLPFAAYWRKGQYVGSSYSQQKAALNLLLQEKGPREIPFVDLPRLIRVSTLNNPYSFTETASPYDLGASFGRDVKLSRVILELTDSPLTPLPEIWPQALRTIGPQSPIFGVR